jgi:NAD-dependent deacetylase
VEINGNIWISRCVQCGYQHRSEEDLGDEPRCPVCGDWLRPDVVWPGEPLPEEEFTAAREAGELADLMLSIGTSGEHQPAASMIWQAKATDATIIEINPTLTTASHLADIRLQALPEKAIPALVSELKHMVLHQP